MPSPATVKHRIRAAVHLPHSCGRHPRCVGRRPQAAKGTALSTAHVTYGQRHGWTLIHIGGDLDLTAVSAVRERLLGLIWDGCRQLVVDLGGLDFCDSGGFAVLVATRRQMAARGGELRLVLPAPASKARAALSAFGTDRVFQTYASAADALADCRPATDADCCGTQALSAGQRPPLGAMPRQRK